MNSLAKGKRAERAFRDLLRSHGYQARRGQQFSGSPDSPDVVCPDLPFHFEVKHVERLDLQAAMDQSVGDAGQQVPVVAHKRNGKDWLVTMRASDWFWLVKLPFPPSPDNRPSVSILGIPVDPAAIPVYSDTVTTKNHKEP